MTGPAWLPAAVEVCCGEGGSWARPGEAFVTGCQLCKRSPSYWQRGRTAPYAVSALGSNVDQAALDARLAKIVADETWPEDLRAEAELAAEDGLEIQELTDDAIVTALNRRIVERDADRPVRR
ncbi:hypothetical protein DFJ67_7011 [Asanoa ferruginea]|uniref:Uncharacterized protein n=1 Tax=Asanoa ferruginea TaxID=53367 RepID=A0A3D9ZUR8_9ACTN|nr:hypothetical protein [Asanoa ferruginea]REG00942.1 hypothetical protein DFJ67_7011 [Asanoa ferruginea]